MDRLVVNAKVRTTTGKSAAKAMRQQGLLPAVMYNSKGEATMLSVSEAEFTKVWKQATSSTLIQLDVEGNGKFTAFIKDTCYNILADANLHVDFHVVDEDKPLKANVNVIVEGNPVGVREGGSFEKGIKVVTVECKPAALPPRIVADVSNLGLGSQYRVKDLPFGADVKVLTNAESMIAQVRA